jgi:hypothetical protein
VGYLELNFRRTGESGHGAQLLLCASSRVELTAWYFTIVKLTQAVSITTQTAKQRPTATAVCLIISCVHSRSLTRLFMGFSVSFRPKL